jgi:hypothetical protein
MTKILSYDLKKKKTILCGQLMGKTFFKDVMPFHYMRMVGGYGISEDAFQKIIGDGCEKVVIKEVKTGNQWESKIKDWFDHCLIADYGSGKQRFLSLKYMRTHKKASDE